MARDRGDRVAQDRGEIAEAWLDGAGVLGDLRLPEH
jgi:hypothetical protein